MVPVNRSPIHKLSLREIGPVKNYNQLNYKLLRGLIEAPDFEFKLVWKRAQKGRALIRFDKVFLNNGRDCYSLNHIFINPIPKLFSLGTYLFRTRFNENKMIVYKGPIDNKKPAPAEGFRPFILLLNDDNHLLRIDFETGQLLEKVYLGSLDRGKFGYLFWVKEPETILIQTVDLTGKTGGASLGYCILMDVNPLRFVACFQLPSYHFKGLKSPSISDGMLIMSKSISSGTEQVFIFSMLDILSPQNFLFHVNIGDVCHHGYRCDECSSSPNPMPGNSQYNPSVNTPSLEPTPTVNGSSVNPSDSGARSYENGHLNNPRVQSPIDSKAGILNRSISDDLAGTTGPSVDSFNSMSFASTIGPSLDASNSEPVDRKPLLPLNQFGPENAVHVNIQPTPAFNGMQNINHNASGTSIEPMDSATIDRKPVLSINSSFGDTNGSLPDPSNPVNDPLPRDQSPIDRKPVLPLNPLESMNLGTSSTPTAEPSNTMSAGSTNGLLTESSEAPDRKPRLPTNQPSSEADDSRAGPSHAAANSGRNGSARRQSTSRAVNNQSGPSSYQPSARIYYGDPTNPSGPRANGNSHTSPSDLNEKRVGRRNHGLPVNLLIHEKPRLLFTFKTCHPAIDVGGYPYHYIVSPPKSQGVFKVIRFDNGEEITNGTIEFSPFLESLNRVIFQYDWTDRIIAIDNHKVSYHKIHDNQLRPLFDLHLNKIDNEIQQDRKPSVRRKRYFKAERSLYNTFYDNETEIFGLFGLDLDSRKASASTIALFDNLNGQPIKKFCPDFKMDEEKEYDIVLDRDLLMINESDLDKSTRLYGYRLMKNRSNPETC